MFSREYDHRFTLTRKWMGSGGRVNFIMLNPSTADEKYDDPTIRKCIGFSKRWGFSEMVVTNLFSFRATDPRDLHVLIRGGHFERAIGEGNDTAIASAANASDLVVFAWGANAERYPDRVAAVSKMYLRPSCIGLTKYGHPIHPCMAAYTDHPIPITGTTFFSICRGVVRTAADNAPDSGSCSKKGRLRYRPIQLRGN